MRIPILQAAVIASSNALLTFSPFAPIVAAASGAETQYTYAHSGGGLTSAVMASVFSKLPPVTPPQSGVRSGEKLMRTVRLSGAYQADVPLIVPSYTRLVLDGSIDALPYKLRWTADSAGPANQTASMVSVKGGQMVSIEGGRWSCSRWNSSASQGNTTTVTAIYFDSTSFSFIRNLRVSACGSYSGGNASGTFSIGRAYYTSGNIRVAGGQSNVIENVESSHSQSRGVWAQTSKLVVSGGSYHHNNADGIDLDSSSSHNTVYNSSFYMNGRCGIFLEFSASYNTIIRNRIWANHFNGVGTGALDGTQTYNVLLANVLGPSAYPPGCPPSQRPCPSYCPINDSCAEIVGLPCGTCHYIDQPNYLAHGFGMGASTGTIAVLNDLGGSINSASSRGVHNSLVALNYNGTVDDSDKSLNTSAFSFNPGASSGDATTNVSGGIIHQHAVEYFHSGGGLTSAVMASVFSKLPPVTPPQSGVRSGEKLMRTVRLSGAYQADVPLIVPSYTRLVLDGSIDALPYKLRWTADSAGPANQTASMVSVKGGQMVSIEGGRWSCSRWNSSASQGNTTTVTAIYFDSTSFSFIRNLRVSACGSYSGGNASGTFSIGRAYYTSGNIRVAGGQSNVIENVESSHSQSRGVWAQTSKLVVSGGSYHHNNADGIDLDSSSSHNTVYNSSFYMNGRMGIFMEFASCYNAIVGNRLWANHFAGVSPGSDTATSPLITYNVLLANVLGPSAYPPGCPPSQRPCPSYCPINDSCAEVVGLPCGTCHYIDQQKYLAHGFQSSFSDGTIAVLNDLGGSVSGASNGHVQHALMALNYNGTIDNSGVAHDAPDINSSVFSWNPSARHH